MFSDYLQLTAGVPQGTKLGPIGFQIFINNAADDVQSECRKYVDELTFAENSTGKIGHYLQQDLHNGRIEPYRVTSTTHIPSL